jgi:hypothetical protein
MRRQRVHRRQTRRDPPVWPQQLLRAQAGARNGAGGDMEDVVAGVGVPLEALQGLPVDPAVAAAAEAQQAVVRLPCCLQHRLMQFDRQQYEVQSVYRG